MKSHISLLADNKTKVLIIEPTVKEIQMASGLSRRRPNGKFTIEQEVGCPDEFYLAYSTDDLELIIDHDNGIFNAGGAKFCG